MASKAQRILPSKAYAIAPQLMTSIYTTRDDRPPLATQVGYDRIETD